MHTASSTREEVKDAVRDGVGGRAGSGLSLVLCHFGSQYLRRVRNKSWPRRKESSFVGALCVDRDPNQEGRCMPAHGLWNSGLAQALRNTRLRVW